MEVLKDTLSAPNQKPKKISLHTLDKIIIVDMENNIRCESGSNNTVFYLQDGKKYLLPKH